MRAIRNMSIRWKLTAAILLNSVLVLIIAVSAFRIMERTELCHRVLADDARMVEIAAVFYKDKIVFNRSSGGNPMLDKLMAMPRIYSVRVTDQAGEIVVHFKREGVSLDGDDVTAVARRITDGVRVVGRITVHFSNNELFAAPGHFKMMSGIILLIGIAIAFPIAVTLQEVISRRMIRITRRISAMSESGNYGTPLEDPVHNDEISDLIRAFNKLIGQVNDRGRQLQQQQQHLEEMVYQRSQEILEKNRTLEVEVKERTHIERKLRQLNQELEQRVAHRTAALSEHVARLEELSEQLARERNLFIEGPVVVWRWSAEQDWSPEYISDNVRQFGWTAEELLDEPGFFWSILENQDVARVRNLFSFYQQSSARYFEVDYRVVCPDGETRWVYTFVSLVRDEAGLVLHYDGYMLDITERKHMAAALSRSEKRFRLVLEAINEGLWDLDLKQNSLYLGPRWYDMFGYSETDILHTQEGWTAIIADEYRTMVLKEYDRHLEGLTAGFECEYPCKMKNGQMKWVMHRGRVVERDAHGSALRMVGTFTDITRQKQIELEISLQRSLMASMINSIPDVIAYKDMQGVYLGCNPAFNQLVGRSWDTVIGQTNEGLFEPELAQIFNEAECEMHQVKSPVIREHQVRYPDGTVALLSMMRTPYLGPGGDVIGLVIIARDVTGEREAEKELALKQAQLVHSGRLAALGEMSTAIAHELGQPLQIIKTSSEIMAEDLRDNLFNHDHFQSMLEKTIRQVDRAVMIIRNVRSFARQDTDRTFEPKTNLALPVRDAVSFFCEQFKDHGIKLELDIHDDVLPLRISPQKFQQVVVNLLSNARYAVTRRAEDEPSLAKCIWVRLWSEQEDGTSPIVMLEIEDNGTGMSEEDRERCMDPFYTTKPVGQGTGLGLSILHGIVHEFGGHCEIRSQLGKGTCFRVMAPVDDVNGRWSNRMKQWSDRAENEF